MGLWSNREETAPQTRGPEGRGLTVGMGGLLGFLDRWRGLNFGLRWRGLWFLRQAPRVEFTPSLCLGMIGLELWLWFHDGKEKGTKAFALVPTVGSLCLSAFYEVVMLTQVVRVSRHP